ncbi:MAG: aminotransferase class I/II-fold pyridoxal phosphate-dependent enzyme, partial [Longispora sp.]|nr:aminotransferase class I/II-fold pyridoxal phosphate-dependent enzyme [Longispora sp. (in: high G+C Gram-positive bacteria)]
MTATLSLGAINTAYSFFKFKTDELKNDGLYRYFLPVEHLTAEPGLAIADNRKIQVWCSNDYLGMSRNPEVIAAQIRSTSSHGTGTGGSRNISGTTVAHVRLESELASWHGKESALVFSSGYVANLETLSTI